MSESKQLSILVLTWALVTGLTVAASAAEPILRFDFTGGSSANTGAGGQTAEAVAPGEVVATGGIDGTGCFRNHAAPADGVNASEQRGRLTGVGLPNELRSITVTMWLKADVPFANSQTSNVSLFDCGGFSLTSRDKPSDQVLPGRFGVSTGNSTQPVILFNKAANATPDFGAGDIGEWRFVAATVDMVFNGGITTTTVNLYRGSLTDPVGLWGAGSRTQDGDHTTEVMNNFGIGNFRIGDNYFTQRQFLGEIDDVRFYGSGSSGEVLDEAGLEGVRAEATGTPKPMSRPGDTNGDGKVDISDPVTLLGFLFQGSPEKLRCGNGSGSEPGNVAVNDCNGDGKVDISDTVCILSFLFQGGPPHAAGTQCIVVEQCPPTCQ